MAKSSTSTYASGKFAKTLSFVNLARAFSSGSVVRSDQTGDALDFLRSGRRGRMRRNVIGVILAGFCILPPVHAQTVTVSPIAVSLHLGTFYQFKAKVTGTTPT